MHCMLFIWFVVEGYLPYVAMYQFEARSADELSFQPGDVVWVRIKNVYNELNLY